MGLLIKKNLLLFITGLIFLNVGISDPFKDLDINFLLEDSTKPKSTKKVKNTEAKLIFLCLELDTVI